MKNAIYRYLDQLFKKTKIKQKDTELGTVYRAVFEDGRVLMSTNLDTKRHSIHFNFDEYKFIKLMFGLTDGQCVDIIREYLGDKIDPRLHNLGFHPFLG